ncbi:MAG: adenylosuccinate synthetase [Elusimicrobiota bacterium]
MPVTIVVGGQKGDEGKGKIAAYLACRDNYDICVRISGPNAGHTIKCNDNVLGLATVPSGFINSSSRLLIGRGAFVDAGRLLDEIEKTGLEGTGRLGVDMFATVITAEQREAERADQHLMSGIGSVGTGLGQARIDKIKRRDSLVFAKDIAELKPYLSDTTEEIFRVLEKGGKVLLEGDQGYSLSLIHGEYPYVTSRDTTASTFMGEVGVGPGSVDDVYIVFKPYTTRVAAGPLAEEIKEVPEWYHKDGGEVGTVSGRKRRIGGFEWENAVKAVKINGATKICITHMDVFGDIRGHELPAEAEQFLRKLKEELEAVYPYPKLSLISYGPEVNEVKEL